MSQLALPAGVNPLPWVRFAGGWQGSARVREAPNSMLRSRRAPTLGAAAR